MSAEAETRERLLKAGAQLFGERGFRKVTVREICRVAEANVAAINYHFGDKLGLYRQVLQSAIEAMRATTEIAREAGQGQPPEEQLRQFITIFLHRLLTPGHESVHRLIHREMHDPTPALDAIVDQAIRPRVEYLSGVVGRMIGCDPSNEAVLRAVASIHAQATSYMPNPLVPGHRNIAARLGFTFQPTPAGIATAAEHIATFSIAGVHAIGRSIPVATRARRRSG
jgi:TetR/AcrR family transcriptional regulator, regulator of cefoperazone and chloramphenicol sensitivity